MKTMLEIMTTVFLMIAASAAIAAERVYTLQDAYDAALATNEIVKIAEEGVLQAESRIDQAWTYLYPRLSGQAGYTRYNEVLPPDSSFVFQPLAQLRGGLLLTQPIYTGGRTLAALRTTQTLTEISKHGLSTARQDALLNTAQAYYGVLKAQKTVEIGRRSLDRMERHKKVTEREAATRKNKANMSALLRASTLVSQARINLVRAEEGLKVARQKLALLTKLPEDGEISEPLPFEPPKESLEQLKESALSNRDDYAGSRLNQNVAAENVKIVKGAHYPQFYAEGALQLQDSHPETLTDGTIYYGGVRLQIPIFEGGLMKAEVSEARSRLRQADLSTAFLRRSIETDVHEAYLNLQTQTSVLDTARLQVQYAKENFDAVEGLFSEGLISSLSLIDAEQALSLAERELANATYDQQVAIVRLKKSLGLLGKN